MHLIDRYAYGNRIRQVDPALKAGLASTILLLCLLLNEPLVGLVAVGGTSVLTITIAHIPAKTFGRVLLAQAAFLIMATIGIVISVSLVNPTGFTDWSCQIGPLWLSSSPAALQQAGLIVTRALGAAAAMNFLALTTPLVDLLDLGRRLHVPIILLDLMTLTYRFIFVLLDSLDTMYNAQACRLGYHTSYRRSMNNAAVLGSRLFIDAFQRSRRLEIALQSRGFESDLRVLPTTYERNGRLLAAGLLIALSMVVAWIIA